MPTRRRTTALQGPMLGGNRHLCGLFDGPLDAAEALLPLVAESLSRGDRVVRIVRGRTDYLRRLAQGADISAAVESGQLEVRTWDETYLSDGHFDASSMLAYVRRCLREGPSRGWPATRLVADMGWVQDGVPGIDVLAAYEHEVNAVVARPHTTVVCAYDTRRRGAGWIARIVAAHEATLAGGRLQPTGRIGRPSSPRERIMAAAALLFAEAGLARTGVDTLIGAADVAKATFYRHFPSKDALVVAWLNDPGTRWFDRVRVEAELGVATPDEVLPRFFEAVAKWLESGDFVGCPYLNTALELSDPAHPASRPIRDHLAEIRQWLVDRAAAVGAPDPVRVGAELHALVAGAISLGVAERTSAPVFAARDAAVRLTSHA
jgi:AcrR family transcriptional regulator